MCSRCLRWRIIAVAPDTGRRARDRAGPEGLHLNLQLRSDLIIQLRKRLAMLGDKQSEWAALLGLSQPRVSDLLRGKIERFSVDTLISFLGRTGAEVRLTVRNKRQAA